MSFENSMKSETIEEARERLKAQTAAEREGSRQAQEGQLAIVRTEEQDKRAEQINEIAAAQEKTLIDVQGGVVTSDIKETQAPASAPTEEVQAAPKKRAHDQGPGH